MSLTLAELVERTGSAPKVLRHVLAEEIAVGRVAWTADGRYALDVTCFSPDTLAGLRWLSGARPSDTAEVDRTLPVAALLGAEEVG